MPRDYATQATTAIRRSDRAVTDETWIRAFLHQASVGTLATLHDGQPFINANLFVYDETDHCIYIHTASVGRTRANVEQEMRVCFSIMAMGRLLPADRALEFSVEYAGVVVFGRATLVEDNVTAKHALRLLLDKYAPHLHAQRDYRPPVDEELKRTAVFRVAIEDWSAKKKEVAPDFPNAFWYPEEPILESARKQIIWQGQVVQVLISLKGTGTMQSITEVEAVAGHGLRGDRYFERAGTFSETPGAGREVTLVALEDLEAAAFEDNLHITPEMMRRNIVTRGVPLNYLVGKTFHIGEVTLVGRRLCEPCDHLGKLTGLNAKLIRTLHHRAGLRADIVRGGILGSGDVIRPTIVDKL